MKSRTKSYFQWLLVIIGLWSEPLFGAQIYLGQGIIAGEVTTDSVLLHTRLTAAESVMDGDVPGIRGVVRFEVATNAAFTHPIQTEWLPARPSGDYIVQAKIAGLKPDTDYFYRTWYGSHERQVETEMASSFRTLGGAGSERPVKFVVGSCMDYTSFHQGAEAATGVEKDNGYRAFTSMYRLRPDFFVGNGNNVYYDPPQGPQARAIVELRRKWHEQFVQVTLGQLFSLVPTYWLKGDHDYRGKNTDRTGAGEPSHGLGVQIFREQVPVVDLSDPNAVTYRTCRINRHLQLWFLEGCDYRSPDKQPDGPEKSRWGKEQKEWLMRTLKASDATFKLLLSPAPLIGAGESFPQNSAGNGGGFQCESREFFEWLQASKINPDELFILCGGQPFPYRAQLPSGYEEFSGGALNTQNATQGPELEGTPGARPGTRLLYASPKPLGGFIFVEQKQLGVYPQLTIVLKDESGTSLHHLTKTARPRP